MTDNFIETPITPSSLPTKSGELSYGPDLIPQPSYTQPEFAPPAFNSSPYSIDGVVDPFVQASQMFEKNARERKPVINALAEAAPTPFNAEGLLFDRYATSWDFSEKGFIPWRDNEETYNQDSNVLKELYRSSKWAAPLFGEGFVSGMRTFPDLIAGMYNGNLDQIFKTDDVLAEKWSRAVKMGSSQMGGVSSFLTNFEISAANMLGMVVETAIEDVVIGAITTATGGATAPLAVAQAGRTATVFANIYKGLKNINKVVDIFSEAKNARRLWEVTGKGLGMFGAKTVDFLNPLRQSVGGFTHGGFIKDLVKGEDYLKGASPLSQTVQGFGSFYRDLREINFALTEAKLEGGFSYVDRREEMINEYVKENGYLPQGEDAQNIEKNARASGDFTTKLNLPVIYYSNRIGFGNLFKGFTPLNKLLSETADNSSVFRNIRFNNANKLFEEVKGFSLKNSFRSGLGTSLNYFKANYMEGIQENIQETIQGASKDYYDQRFKNNPSYGGMNFVLGDLSASMPDLFQNFKNQFSGQGLSTFLSGALMGTIPAGGMKAISGIGELTYRFSNPQGYQEFKQKRSERINDYVNRLNEVYKDPLKYFDPQLMNAARQGELSKYLQQAVLNKNKKLFYDIKDQSVYEHLWTVVSSGKTELFKDKLEELKQLSPEEFENALGFKVEKPEEFKSYIDDQINKVDQIQKMYDKANEKLSNPVNLNAFKKGTSEYEEAAAQYVAFENAKQQAVFANYSFMRNAERMSGLLTEMTNSKIFGKQTASALGKTSYLDFSMLMEPNLLNVEMQMLKKEIDSLSQGDVESKKLAQEKLKRLRTLELWKTAMESEEIKGDTTETEGKGRFPKDYPSADNPAYEGWRNQAKLAFEKIVQTEAEINKDFAYRESIDDVFELLMDYHTLGRESKGLMEVVNILADPDNFLKLYQGHFTVIQDLKKKRIQVLLDAYVNALKTIVDPNSLIGALAVNGYVEDPENPGQYYKISGEEISQVDPESEDATKIEQIIKDHEEATKETPETPEASDIEAKKADIESKTKEELFPIGSLHKGKESGDTLKVIGYTKDGVRFEIQTEGTLKPTKNVILSELKRLIKEGKLTSDVYAELAALEGAEPVSEQVNIRLNEEQDAYLIDHNGVTYQVWIDEPTLFFTETADGDLELVENKDVPDVVKTELNKFIAANPPKLSLADIIKKIEEADTIDDLDPYLDPEDLGFTDVGDLNQIGESLKKRIREIMDKEGLTSIDDKSPEFIEAYNNARLIVSNGVKKPKITEQEIKDLFKIHLEPVIKMLTDPVLQTKYKSIVLGERNKLIEKLKSNQKARDINAAKIEIDKMVKSAKTFTEIADEFDFFIPTLHKDIIQEVTEYYLKKLDDKLQDETKDLIVEDDVVKNNEILKEYINSLKDYKKSVEKSLDNLLKQAEEVKAKTAGINLLIDVSALGFFNNVHYKKTNKPVYNASYSQLKAIQNLVAAGVLDPDFDPSYASDSHGASELINEAVARIHVIGINKGIYAYLRTGDVSLLEKEYTDYLNTQSDYLNLTPEEIKQDVSDKINALKNADKTTTAILEVLDLTGAEDLSDEQYKALKQIKSSIYKVQSEASLLEGLQQLEERLNKYLSEARSPETLTLEELIDLKSIMFVKSFLKQKKTSTELQDFYNDLLETIEKIQSLTTVKEAEKMLKSLAYKHGKPSEMADLLNSIKAFVGAVLEIKAVTAGETTPGEELTEEEILRVINGEKRSLTFSQRKQIEQYQKDLFEITKGKLSNAPGYQDVLLDLSLEELVLPEVSDLTTSRLRFLALRQKDAADVRTAEELTKEFDVVDGKINVKKALQNIINSDFATSSEKEIARVLMQVLPPSLTMDVNNTMQEAGSFDPETERGSVNLNAVGYQEEYPSNPIETVILHELLHGQIEKALQEQDGAYKNAIKSLYAAVAADPAAKSFYSMQDLSDDDKLREFVIEAFTNPAFQHLLAKIPYAKSGKSTWQKFIEILSDLLKSVGLDIENTVLGEVINQTTELIKFDYTNKTLDKVAKASTLEEISELEQEVSQETGTLSPSIQESMMSVLKLKQKSILGKKVYQEEIKKLSRVKIDGKTYYYKKENDVIQLFRLSDQKLVRVKSAKVISQFIADQMRTKSLAGILGEKLIARIKDLMGDPFVPGTYGSGVMSDVSIFEGRLREAFEASPVLKFKDINQFDAFRKEYWRRKRRGEDVRRSAFASEYPNTGINSYIELANLFGGLNFRKGKNVTDQIFNRLIRMGVLKIKPDGETHEDYTNREENPVTYDDFIEVYELLLKGVKVEVSEKQLLAEEINKEIGKRFNAPGVTEDIQEKIENILRKETFDLEASLEEEPPVTEETKETEKTDDLDITSKDPAAKKTPNPAAFDASVIDPFNTITAINRYGLRSYPYDLNTKENNQENESFRLYYHKIRKIINALHLKSSADLSNIFITLSKDEALLRWDGSSQSQDWIESRKGVIGYLSDNQGNPFIFNSTGEIVGTLDRNDLANKKGLDNGENQIVYFNTITEKSRQPIAQAMEAESKKKLLEARKRAKKGQLQIAKLIKITEGRFNAQTLVVPSSADQGSTLNEDELQTIVWDPSTTFGFNQLGQLVAYVKDLDGAVNQLVLHAPKIKNVTSKKDESLTLFKQVLNVMMAIQEMKISGKDVSKLEKQFLAFTSKMFYSNDKSKIKFSTTGVELRSNTQNPFKPYSFFTISDGKVSINENNVQQAQTFIENFYLNVSQDWFSGKNEFLFPIVDVVNDEKTVRFVKYDYKNFLFNKVGMKANTKSVPKREELMRYNSLILFTDPQTLIPTPKPNNINETDLLEDPSIVEKTVEKNINQSSGEADSKKDIDDALDQFGDFYIGPRSAPSYSQIFEKTCK